MATRIDMSFVVGVPLVSFAKEELEISPVDEYNRIGLKTGRKIDLIEKYMVTPKVRMKIGDNMNNSSFEVDYDFTDIDKFLGIPHKVGELSYFFHSSTYNPYKFENIVFGEHCPVDNVHLIGDNTSYSMPHEENIKLSISNVRVILEQVFGVKDVSVTPRLICMVQYR